MYALVLDFPPEGMVNLNLWYAMLSLALLMCFRYVDTNICTCMMLYLLDGVCSNSVPPLI